MKSLFDTEDSIVAARNTSEERRLANICKAYEDRIGEL